MLQCGFISNSTCPSSFQGGCSVSDGKVKNVKKISKDIQHQEDQIYRSTQKIELNKKDESLIQPTAVKTARTFVHLYKGI